MLFPAASLALNSPDLAQILIHPVREVFVVTVCVEDIKQVFFAPIFVDNCLCFRLDLDRHNAQYPPVDVRTCKLSHDRFLIVDDAVYHIGASLKDLGKKWFAFSKLSLPTEMITNLL